MGPMVGTFVLGSRHVYMYIDTGMYNYILDLVL